MDKRLTYRYYEDIDSDKRILLQAIGCFRRCGQYIYEYTYRHIERTALMHLTDVTFFLICNADHSLNLMAFQDLTLNPEVFEIENYHGPWEMEIRTIEHLLDGGEFVVLQTNVVKLPFHNDYLGPESEKFLTPLHHSLLLVGHDTENFYYADAPWELNTNHVSLDTNETVGVFSKNKMRDVVDNMLSFMVMKVRNHGYFDEDMWFKNALQASVDNYSKHFSGIASLGDNLFSKTWIKHYHENNVVPKNGDTWNYYSGRDACVEFTELICDKEVSLDKLFDPCPDNLVFWYSIIFGSIAGKRLVLLRALEEYSQSKAGMYDKAFASVLNESLKTWQILFARVRKKAIARDYTIDTMLKDRFTTVITVEDALMNEMSNYLSKL
jgi:hypothetical protein